LDITFYPMKVILSGYDGSKKILTASAYLTTKHLRAFDIYYLNYGEFSGELFGAHYIKLKDKQANGSLDWSKDIAEYLETLNDKRVIFALDDYFLEEDMNMELFNSVKDEDYVNLCAESMDNCSPEKHKKYAVTTQYTLWNRDLLLEVLKEVRTPWEFENDGSDYFFKIGMPFKCVPCLKYPPNSALSGRWEGVRTYGREIKYL